MITSLTNTKIKSVVQLRNRKEREESGLTIVEGKREVARALEAGTAFKELYICNDLGDDLLPSGLSSKVPVFETTGPVFSKLSYGDRAEGILAVIKPDTITLKDLSSKAKPLFVIVESVEKPGNLGAILRTCDGAGVDGVIICDGRTDIYNPNAIRASLGTIFSQKIAVCSNEEAAEFLRSKKIAICATLPQAKSVYSDEDLKGALAVVVGSEQKGLTQYWIDQADLKVKIPMKGFSDSLNVSASTAVLLYEIIRQRSK